MDPRETNRLAGIFLMVHGGLQAFIMLLLGLIYGVAGVALFTGAPKNEDQIAGLAILVIAVFVVLFSLVFVLPQFIGGWKMIKGRPNARTWGIIGSILACMSFPLGTAAGVFGLVFLFGDKGTRFYLGEGAGRVYMPPQPPPPNSWQ